MAPSNKFSAETEVQQLEQEGFSRDQIAGLFALRDMYTQGVLAEHDPAERRRQEFIRWLYLQGRLQS